jgi:hypothetical protein
MKDFELNFPNYQIQKFELQLDNKETFESLIYKLSNLKGKPINTNLDKTTCFNIIPSLSKDPSYFNVIFAGRNNNESYRLYSGNIDKKLNTLTNLEELSFQKTLSYPSIFLNRNKVNMICSIGRYGSDGLLLSTIKI